MYDRHLPTICCAILAPSIDEAIVTTRKQTRKLAKKMLNLCRLCLSDENLFDVYNRNVIHAKKVRQMILQATDIDIKMDDITTTVCQKCCSLVLSIHNFQKSAIANNAAIQKYATEVYRGALKNCLRWSMHSDKNLELSTLSRSSSESSLTDSLELRLSSETDIVESDKIVDEDTVVNFDDTVRPDYYEFNTSEQSFVSGCFKCGELTQILGKWKEEIKEEIRNVVAPSLKTEIMNEIGKQNAEIHRIKEKLQEQECSIGQKSIDIKIKKTEI